MKEIYNNLINSIINKLSNQRWYVMFLSSMIILNIIGGLIHLQPYDLVILHVIYNITTMVYLTYTALLIDNMLLERDLRKIKHSNKLYNKTISLGTLSPITNIPHDVDDVFEYNYTFEDPYYKKVEKELIVIKREEIRKNYIQYMLAGAVVELNKLKRLDDTTFVPFDLFGDNMHDLPKSIMRKVCPELSFDGTPDNPKPLAISGKTLKEMWELRIFKLTEGILEDSEKWRVGYYVKQDSKFYSVVNDRYKNYLRSRKVAAIKNKIKKNEK